MSEINEFPKPDTQKITEIKAIEESVIIFKKRDEISQYVEKPLVSACEHFWDLGIRTLMSSANSKDIGTYSYIDLDYDSLSEENKKIAENLLAQKNMLHGSEPTPIFKLNILQITPETSINMIEEQANKIANSFKRQKPTWIPTMTLQDLRKLYTGDPNCTEIKTEDLTDDYYYDNKNQLFYLSEEHYNKTQENQLL